LGVNKDSFPIRFLAPFGDEKNLSKILYINANRGKITSQVNSARQTQPSKLRWFEERAAGPSDDKPTDKEGRRCYATIAFVIAEGKQREAFKIPMMRVQEWVEINLKAFPLPFYASFGLMAAPPLKLNCGTCGKEHDKDDGVAILSSCSC
jgi:hypothetical protein